MRMSAEWPPVAVAHATTVGSVRVMGRLPQGAEGRIAPGRLKSALPGRQAPRTPCPGFAPSAVRAETLSGNRNPTGRTGEPKEDRKSGTRRYVGEAG
jgi:hypothetical protein